MEYFISLFIGEWTIVSNYFLSVLYFKAHTFPPFSSGSSAPSITYLCLSKHSHKETVKPLVDNLTSSFPPREMNHARWVSSTLDKHTYIVWKRCEFHKRNKQSPQNTINSNAFPENVMIFLTYSCSVFYSVVNFVAWKWKWMRSSRKSQVSLLLWYLARAY